jgi:hypothetical protein
MSTAARAHDPSGQGADVAGPGSVPAIPDDEGGAAVPGYPHPPAGAVTDLEIERETITANSPLTGAAERVPRT